MARFLKLHGKHVDELNFYHSFVELDQRAHFEIEEKTKKQSNFEWLAHRQVSTVRLSWCCTYFEVCYYPVTHGYRV